MLIPNADRAVVDIRKLVNYVLSPTHERGKHKARMFSSVFGLVAADAEELRDYLLQVVKSHQAHLGERGNYGQMYWIDSLLTWNSVTAGIRSTWIIRHNEDFPRLVSCFVSRKGSQ